MEDATRLIQAGAEKVSLNSAAVKNPDLINQITADFKYERDLLDFCGKSKMDRVVVAIDSGEYIEASDPYFVPYLVFELCEQGGHTPPQTDE